MPPVEKLWGYWTEDEQGELTYTQVFKQPLIELGYKQPPFIVVRGNRPFRIVERDARSFEEWLQALRPIMDKTVMEVLDWWALYQGGNSPEEAVKKFLHLA